MSYTTYEVSGDKQSLRIENVDRRDLDAYTIVDVATVEIYEIGEPIHLDDPLCPGIWWIWGFTESSARVSRGRMGRNRSWAHHRDLLKLNAMLRLAVEAS